jgi:hypothetical protein
MSKGQITIHRDFVSGESYRCGYRTRHLSFWHSFVIRYSCFVTVSVHSCLFVVNPWLPFESRCQPTEAVRVTVEETYFASAKANLRTSMTTFCIGKLFSRCAASRSANVSMRLTD